MSYTVSDRAVFINNYDKMINSHQLSIDQLNSRVKLVKSDSNLKEQLEILQKQAEQLLLEVSKTQFQVAKIPYLKNRTAVQKDQIASITLQIESAIN